jgi:hypothetical protein
VAGRIQALSYRNTCWARRSILDLPAQLLGHQDLAQVILAKDAWPLRLGWK